MENVIFEQIFSTDETFMEANLVVIKINNKLFGIHTEECVMDGSLVFYTIDVEKIPDWADLKEVNEYADTNYKGDEKGDELYQLISDVISSYRSNDFDNSPNYYDEEEMDAISDGGIEDFDNQDFINLLFK